MTPREARLRAYHALLPLLAAAAPPPFTPTCRQRRRDAVRSRRDDRCDPVAKPQRDAVVRLSLRYIEEKSR